MGDGTAKNPYTRKDVLRLIEEHGGSEGLDFSGKYFEEESDLSRLNLSLITFDNSYLFGAKFDGSNLMGVSFKGANLHYATFNPIDARPANLEGADLRNAHLGEAGFIGANLTSSRWGEVLPGPGSRLDNTDLRNAKLFLADFKNCYLYDTKLEGAHVRGADIYEAHLEEADWGNYVIGEEGNKDFRSAENIYRRLKMWYNTAGMYSIAGKFFYREMTVKRKSLRWLSNPFPKLRETLYWLLCGYGERPWQAFASAVVIVVALALIYFAIGTLTPNSFPHSLYYSMVSFTALGYGSWAAEPMGWVKWLGACESFLGVFIMALFLITFTRKMIR